jgi:hypothetical protein
MLKDKIKKLHDIVFIVGFAIPLIIFFKLEYEIKLWWKKVRGGIKMGKVKCCTCGALAHHVIDGKLYCLKCFPTTDKMINTEKIERPKEWPEPPSDRLLRENEQPMELIIEQLKPLYPPVQIELNILKEKSFWRTLFGIK